MAFNFAKMFAEAEAQRRAQFGGRTWWNDYQAAYAGGKDALKDWAQTAGTRYADFDGPGAGDFVGSQVAGLQAINSNSKQDKLGAGAATVAKVGLVAAAIYSGGVAAGAFEGGAAAAGTTIAGDAALADSALIAPAAAETTGAFDVAGSAGVFSSTGAPLYASPALSPFAGAGEWLSGAAKSALGALTSSALAKGAAAPGGAPGRSLLPSSSSSSSTFPSARRASSSSTAAANDAAFVKVALAIAGALAGVALIARFA